jgi:hypothetical protein
MLVRFVHALRRNTKWRHTGVALRIRRNTKWSHTGVAIRIRRNTKWSHIISVALRAVLSKPPTATCKACKWPSINNKRTTKNDTKWPSYMATVALRTVLSKPPTATCKARNRPVGTGAMANDATSLPAVCKVAY